MEAIIHKKVEFLEKLLPTWKNLQREFRDITVFQEIGWMKNCWDYIKEQERATPYIVEIRIGSKTIGIIPLYCSLEQFAGVNFRILKPIGMKYSDYLIPILSKEYSTEKQIDKALEIIFKDKSSWDCINWEDLPGDTDFDQVFNKLLMERSSSIERKKTDVCPYLMLDNDIEKVKSKLNKKLLKGILYDERRLKREGNLFYHRVVSEEEIEPILNMLFKLHCERWEDTETPSDFKNSEEREHVIRAAKGLFKSDLLYLSYLIHNEEIMVVHYGMSDGKRNYLYLHAINNKFKQFSVGNILAYNLILDACKEGYDIVDFLKGDEAYKKKWGTVDKFNVQYVFYNNTLKSMLCKKIHHTYYSQTFYERPIRKQLPTKLVIRAGATILNILDGFKPPIKS